MVLFYIYPNHEVIQIVTIMQVPASQFVVASRPCSLLNWNDNGYSVTNAFCKTEMIMLRMMSCSIFDSNPILIAAQLMVINACVTPNDLNLWRFLVNVVTHVSTIL
jgi:hypothetical protein